jgi:clan AA aspartic protease
VSIEAKKLSKSRILPVYPEPVGEVAVQITLENTVDKARARLGDIPASQIRTWTGTGVVDTGAVMLAIPQDIFEQLGLTGEEKAVVRLADNTQLELAVAGPVDLTVGNRKMSTEALVLPPKSEVLIGQIILERLDLLVDCQNQTLVPRPESPIYPSLNLK